ncbi:MAG: hypothetical protein DSY76_06910 [Bacteroidetes bacterium]|nr:MAG: hypothetical protein DSY76_06910 [Bacteroidota bacterium]
MKKILIFSLLTVFAFSMQLKAQDSGWKSGNSISVGFPVNNLNQYTHSIGVYGNVDYNFNKHFAARFDLGWNDFSGPEKTWIDQSGNTHTDQPNMSVWEFTAGLRVQVSILYIEARGGYYTGINSWGVTPAVGLRLGKFDLQANYNIADKYEWGGIRLAYYWGK